MELLVVSINNRGKIVDGDVNARLRDSSKGRGITVWLMSDCREDGDMGGRGYIKGRRGDGRSSAILKRTGRQTLEDGKVCMRLGKRGRMGDVFCAESVTAVESDRSCQCRVGRTERTAEREDGRAHDMGRRGGGQDDMSNNSIIVNVGDLVRGVIIARRCRCGAGKKQRCGGRNGIRIEPRSGRKRSLIVIVSPTSSLFSNVFRRLNPPSPPPRRPYPALAPPTLAPSPQVPEDQIRFLKIKPYPSCLALAFAPAPARSPGAISHNRSSLAWKECKL